MSSHGPHIKFDGVWKKKRRTPLPKFKDRLALSFGVVEASLDRQFGHRILWKEVWTGSESQDFQEKNPFA
jgi:hypothetical protein